MPDKQRYILLEGMESAIAVAADTAFYDALPPILSHWAYQITDETPPNVFANLDLVKGRYAFSSPFMDKTESYAEPVNAICAIVAELAWARLREDPSLLCLHGAAAEFSGRLVVFPATRRAGKSTLSVALAAAGIRIFTDDFLPLTIAESGVISGISSGVSPRLRLPVPAQIGPIAADYINRRVSLSNKQYTYVAPLKNESASFGEMAPLGGLVFLDRQDGAAPKMREITKAEALKTLIEQNFSRAGNAGDILAMLEFLAQGLPAFSLRYDQAEPAIALLKARFKSWQTALPHYQPKTALKNEIPNGVKPFIRYKDVSTGQFEHAPGVDVVSTDGQRFLTGRNGQSIHYLNEGAALIWQILSEPTSVDEAVAILRAAFPEQKKDQIEADVLRSFKEFAKNGLLIRVGAQEPRAPRATETQPHR